jgi:hypothetical protein
MALQQKCVAYNDFARIRKKFRPNIQTHRMKKKKSGWNHLVCGECEKYKRARSKATKGSVEYTRASKLLDDHYENEEAARRSYYKTRRKVLTGSFIEFLK